MPTEIRHICMADDYADDYYLFETALSEVNNTVRLTFFNTCSQMLDFLKRGNDLPDIILLDMNMPGNLDHQCLVSIKKEAKLRHIPVIIYSTARTNATAKRAFECGAYDYLVKPVTLENLKALIDGLLKISVKSGA